MSWKSVIGGVAGFMVGGPIGAAAGAALGAGLDGLDDDVDQGYGSGLPNLESELTFINDEDGTFLELSVPTVPDHACLAVHARENNGDGYLKSNVQAFADSDGDFVRFLDVRKPSGVNLLLSSLQHLGILQSHCFGLFLGFCHFTEACHFFVRFWF